MFQITGTPKPGDIKVVATNLDSVLPEKVEKVIIAQAPQALLEEETHDASGTAD